MIATAPPKRQVFSSFFHGGIANRGIRPRIAANKLRVIATSASWNVTYLDGRHVPQTVRFSSQISGIGASGPNCRPCQSHEPIS